MTANHLAAITALREALDPWAPGARQDEVTLSRSAARLVFEAVTVPSQVTLAFAKLGLDPADLGFDLDDGRCELYHHDGPLLVVEDYDEHDPDAIRGVAEWFDALQAKAGELADALREQANSICEDCSGYGTVEVSGGDERDCRVCGGTGHAA